MVAHSESEPDALKVCTSESANVIHTCTPLARLETCSSTLSLEHTVSGHASAVMRILVQLNANNLRRFIWEVEHQSIPQFVKTPTVRLFVFFFFFFLLNDYLHDSCIPKWHVQCGYDVGSFEKIENVKKEPKKGSETNCSKWQIRDKNETMSYIVQKQTKNKQKNKHAHTRQQKWWYY